MRRAMGGGVVWIRDAVCLVLALVAFAYVACVALLVLAGCASVLAVGACIEVVREWWHLEEVEAPRILVVRPSRRLGDILTWR